MTASNAAHAHEQPGATGQAGAALEEARAEMERAAAAERRPLLSVPESERLAMIVAVREAQAAGLGGEAIDACVAAIRPTLRAMSGSDYLAVGPGRDLAAIERHLRQGQPEAAVELIRSLSRVRWWASLGFLLLLSVLTVLFWLWRG